MTMPQNPNANVNYAGKALKTIYLAGGCFWGTEAFMARVRGVAHTKVGYANGRTQNPTYEQVCSQTTGHAETVRVQYDPATVTLDALLEAYFMTIDPTSVNRQGGDVGEQYRTGIYYDNAADLPIIEAFLAKKAPQYARPIAVEVQPLGCFFEAEEYHQNYLDKNPRGYCHVNLGKLKELEDK